MQYNIILAGRSIAGNRHNNLWTEAYFTFIYQMTNKLILALKRVKSPTPKPMSRDMRM